ncbi:MAG TPA: nucleoside triphosphate pyrophosphohydrolase [Bacteroidia bacterium]|nr:nucleoside triphosphate pyrophosphohydrolase [Bacteroidia bacterium]
MDERLKAFERLLNIMDDLRAKCPWDKEQTMETLRHLTIEEVYELGDSILAGDLEEVKKELGDILLHIVFYAKIGSETNAFNITDVINQVCDKLIHRHPHIYGEVKVSGAAEVSQNWEQLKLKEGKKSVLEGVPVSLPSLIKSMRIQDKARSAGFDWEEKEQVLDKVEEELKELRVELKKGNTNKIENEFGDLLFSLVNYSRFINVNPEEALERTNRKFISRFVYLENAARDHGKKLTEMSLTEMDVFWNEAKALGL